MSKRKSKKIIWFHRARGVAWGIFGLISFMFGWQNNIGLVWFASVYANALTDWGAGEAADDTALQEHLDRMEERQRRIEQKQDRILHLLEDWGEE